MDNEISTGLTKLDLGTNAGDDERLRTETNDSGICCVWLLIVMRRATWVRRKTEEWDPIWLRGTRTCGWTWFDGRWRKWCRIDWRLWGPGNVPMANTNSLGFVVNWELKELLVGLINCNIEWEWVSIDNTINSNFYLSPSLSLQVMWNRPEEVSVIKLFECWLIIIIRGEIAERFDVSLPSVCIEASEWMDGCWLISTRL